MAQLGARFHGMEEVVGSIPTRSTKSFNLLQASVAVETVEKPVPIATLVLRDLLRAQAQVASPPKTSIRRLYIQYAKTPYTRLWRIGVVWWRIECCANSCMIAQP